MSLRTKTYRRMRKILIVAAIVSAAAVIVGLKDGASSFVVFSFYAGAAPSSPFWLFWLTERSKEREETFYYRHR